MNIVKKQAIERLNEAMSIKEKVNTKIESLDDLSKAFLSAENKSQRNKISADYKKRYAELQAFLEANPELVNAEVERALLTAALGGEYTEEEVRVDARGRRTIKRKVKKVAPNPSAALSYLQNKDKENWSPDPKADPELEDISEIEEDIYGKEN